jgi:hypothetical protein
VPLSPSARRSSCRTAWRLAALAVAAVAAGAAGCGGGGGSGDADPAKVAPKASLVYLEAQVRPEGDQKAAVDDVAKKVLGVDDPGKRIQTLVDQAIAASGSRRSYEDDVKPWLGRRAALAVTSLAPGAGRSQAAAILASKDNGKAREAVNKAADEQSPKLARREYEGVDYRFDAGDDTAAGVVDDYVVVGSEAGFKAVVDASKGEGLADNRQFESVAKDARGKLGFGYLDTRGLIGALGASGQLPGGGASLQSLLGAANQPVTMSLDASSDRVVLEAVAGATRQARQAQASELLTALPGDSWLALAITDFGAAIKRTLDQVGAGIGAGLVETAKQQIRSQTGLDLDRDVLAALGDVAVFVSGSGVLTVGGGVVIQTPDRRAAARTLDKLAPLIRRQGAPSGLRVTRTTIDGARGIKVASPRFPGSINAVLRGDRLVIAYTDAATRQALSPARKLGGSPQFQQAAQSLDGGAPALYVAFAPVANLAAAVSPENAAQIRQYLDAFSTLVAGSQVKGDRQIARLVVNLK